MGVVCVNPSSVQGPGRTDGSAQLLLDIVNGRLPVLVDTWLSVVDVEDCTTAHLLAERDGAPGCRYLVSGATFDVRTAVALLRTATGKPGRVWYAPRVIAALGGAAAGAVAALLRRDGRICARRPSARCCTATGSTRRSPSERSAFGTRRSRSRSAARSPGTPRRASRPRPIG